MAKNTKSPGETCSRLIIIWKDERLPRWSIEFVKKAGVVVSSVEEAISELERIKL